MATFALPAEFRTICRNYPEEIYELFFKTASTALKGVALKPKFLGGIIGMIATLQTWRHDGEFHPHLHIVIPGGGVSVDGKHWLYPKNRDYLMPAKTVGMLFREKFRKGFEKINLPNADTRTIPAEIWKKNFVVDIRNVGNGMSSFKYIAPYMHAALSATGESKDMMNSTLHFNIKTAKVAGQNTEPYPR